MACSVGLLFAAIGSAGAAVCQEPPSSEDVATVASAAHSPDHADRLSRKPLGSPERSISIGGELRLRGEYADGLGFAAEPANDRVALGRLLVHADAKLGSSTRAFLQLGSHLATGRAGGDSPTDENRLDLAQGFIDLTAPLARGTATLRAGRQEMGYGSARLISVRESPNVRRSFDGVRVMWENGHHRIDAFFVRPVKVEPGAFGDRSDGRQKMYGVYSTVPLGPRPRVAVDLYYLGYSRQAARFTQGVGNEERHSFGARLFGKNDQFDWDLEAVYQAGSFTGGKIRAWTVAIDSGFTFEALPWRPRLGLKANVASGDDNPSDRKLGTFNALFPKIVYFTEAAIVAPANVVDLHPSVELAPARDLSLSFGADILWRHRLSDGFYEPALSPADLGEARSRYLGTQAYVAAAWQATRHLELKAWYVHNFAGSSLRGAGGRDIDFLAISAAFKI